MVIGILPRSFQFPAPSVSVWYPVGLNVKRPQIESRSLTVIGRLRDGVTITQAQAELNTLVPSLSTRFPKISSDLLTQSRARVSVEALKSATIAPVRAQLVLLGVLVAVILLIATTNVVNLFLLRTERTSHEIAIALSLGATRSALAQRFVIEGVVLGLASGIVAIPAAAAVLSTKFGFSDREIPRLHEVSFTAGTIVLVVVCATLIGGLVGLVGPTRTGVAGLFDRLRATRAKSNRGWRRAQNGLVALQVAIALTLLVAAALLGRSFWNLRNARIGFEPAERDDLPSLATMGAEWHRVVCGPSGVPCEIDGSIGHASRCHVCRWRAAPAARGPRNVGGMRCDSGRAMMKGRRWSPATGNLASGDYFPRDGNSASRGPDLPVRRPPRQRRP